MMCSNPNQDLDKEKAYGKFDQIPLICSQDIGQKQNSYANKGP